MQQQHQKQSEPDNFAAVIKNTIAYCLSAEIYPGNAPAG